VRNNNAYDNEPESADEVPFEWMKPSGTSARDTGTAPTEAVPLAEGSPRARAAAPGSSAVPGPVPADAGARSPRNHAEVFAEPLPTAALHVRPPQEEVDKRAAEREQAANARPVLPRVLQVLLAVFFPIVLLAGAIRLATSSLFLWVEYHRPGFPADTFGFSTDDRMTYGSYTVDYLLNFTGSRYLGDLVNPEGGKLFAAGEVSHMADVKSVLSMAFLVGLILAVAMLVFIVYLLRHSSGGVRRGLFAGSLGTLVLVIGLGVLAFLGWDTFFTDIHRIFFANGTWTFYLNDTLIRLFPGQFWMDAGILIGATILVVSSLVLAFTWPTKRRRQGSVRAQGQGRRAAPAA
jgi:integral membrane protein (TIGR01906 family)